MNRRFHPLPQALGIALAALPFASAASGAPTDLDQVVVTATRTEVSLRDSLVPVQVIDRAAIERSQATSLQELLRGRAGINVSNQGGPGKLSSLFVRGTASNQVLMLVDGVRIGSATSGMPTFQDLPVEQIERIEIVRGPHSSLYGSEAIGGVIQVFTRAAPEGFHHDAMAGVGSDGFRQVAGSISQRGERGWISLRAARQRTDGIDACRGTAAGWGAGCFADEPDRDGYRNTSYNLRGGVALGESVKLEAHALDVDSFNEYDGSIFGGNEAENRQQVYGVRLDWEAADRIKLSTRAGRTRDRSESFFASEGSRTFASEFDTRRDTASIQADVAMAEGQQLTGGADWQDDRIDSSTPFEVESRDNLGVFVEYLGRFGAHSLQASARNDDNEQFGNHSTGSLAYGLALDHGLRLTASAGTGFKAPTFNDLYYPGFSNPALEPETSRSFNLGLAQEGAGWDWALNLFQTRIEDMIGYDSGFNLVNIDQARIRGAELTGYASLAGFDFNLELTHLDPRNDGATSAHGNLLPRRARNSGRLDVDRSFGAFNAGISATGRGHSFDDAANTVRLGGYGTVDLRLEYALSPAWTLQAKAANVFDRQYETVAWYNQPGREYQLAVRWQSAR